MLVLNIFHNPVFKIILIIAFFNAILLPSPILPVHKLYLVSAGMSLLLLATKSVSFELSWFHFSPCILFFIICFRASDGNYDSIRLLSFILSSVTIFILFSQSEIQSLVKKYYEIIGIFFIYLISVILFVVLLSSIWLKENTVATYLSQGQNYYSAYMVVLVPFLVDFRSKSRKIISLTFVALIFGYSILFSIRGSFLILAIVCICLVLLTKPDGKRPLRLLGILFSLLIGGIIVYVSGMLQEFNKHFEFSRLYDLKISMQMFLDYPLIGVGTENWHKMVWQYPLHEYYPLSLYYNTIVPPAIHNLHFKRLSEWGVLSILYYIPLVYLTLKSILRWSLLSDLEKRALIFVVIVFALQLFYRSAGHLPDHFSQIELIQFSALGMLSTSTYGLKISKYIFLVLIVITITLSNYAHSTPLDKSYYPPYEIMEKVRTDLSLAPTDESIIEDLDQMKFWFPIWNEALALEMEFYYKNDNFKLFNDRVNQILNNKDNKPYLVYCWFYSIDYMSLQDELSIGAKEYWKNNREIIKNQLGELLNSRQRDSSKNIKLHGKMKQFIQDNKIIIK